MVATYENCLTLFVCSHGVSVEQANKIHGGVSPVIYFIRAEGVGHIKIGWTEGTEAVARLRDLQVGSPVPLTCLKTIPGGRELEQELHRRFAAAHVHGEWFRPVPDLLKFIEVVDEQPSIVGHDVRFVTVKVMTISGKQVTQAMFRQLPERSIIDWDRGWELGMLMTMDACLVQGAVPWGRVTHGLDGVESFHLVWQRGQELCRCVIAKRPDESFLRTWFDEGYSPGSRDFKAVRLSEWDRDMFKVSVSMWREAFERFAALDHLFIGV